MMTGYFGIPGETPKSTTVHLTANDGLGERPICGVKLRPGMEFQFCASGWRLDYVECRSCVRIANSQDEHRTRRRKAGR